MELLESPFQSLENAVVWLLIVFSVGVVGLALLERAGAARLSVNDRRG